MTRSRTVTPKLLDGWLNQSATSTPGKPYVFRLLREQIAGRNAIESELLAYVQEAHDDARLKLRKALDPTLAPFTSAVEDPAYGYPQDLNVTTLMGYFGEVLAGLIIEHIPIHDQKSWKVPAFLFRFHQVAFQKLQVRRDLLQQQITPQSPDAPKEIIPGRTGNDLLAFLTAPTGKLSAILVCEAKCFASHNAKKASDAHGQLSAFSETRCPSGVVELIEILHDYDTPEAKAWCENLRQFYYDPKVRLDRFTALSYATGNAPKTRKTWLSSVKADAKYSGKQPLEVIEVHLCDPHALVKRVYR